MDDGIDIVAGDDYDYGSVNVIDDSADGVVDSDSSIETEDVDIYSSDYADAMDCEVQPNVVEEYDVPDYLTGYSDTSAVNTADEGDDTDDDDDYLDESDVDEDDDTASDGIDDSDTTDQDII